MTKEPKKKRNSASRSSSRSSSKSTPRSTSRKRDSRKRTAHAIRDAISAALFQEGEITEEITAEHPPQKDAPKLLRAVDALEPVLADAVKRRPSFLGRLAYGTAQLVSTLASEDEASSRRIADIAKGSHVGIVFIDVVGFTAYTSQQGDDAAVKLVRRLESLVQGVCRRFQGEVVKHLGDGFLLAFGSGSRAVRAALALRDAAREEREEDPSFQPVRIAVHAGRPSVVRDDLIGHDVNLTARLLEFCDPGEVIVTDEVKQLAEKKLKTAAFSRERRVSPRGVPDKVTTYRVERTEAPAT